MSIPRLSKAKIIADIRRVARLLGHSPSSVEYGRLGEYHIRTVQRKFGAPWPEIIRSSGLRYTPRTSGRVATTEELRRDVLRVAWEVGHPPSRSDYKEQGRFDDEVIRRRTGERWWEDAVAALTGISREEVKLHQRRGGKRFRTTGERLAKLREISRALGHAPSVQEVNRCGMNAHALRQRVGGGWEDVLVAAGIDLSARSKRALALSAATDALMDDVIAVSRCLGHVPTRREYQKYGRYSLQTLTRRMGGWRKVKRLAREG